MSENRTGITKMCKPSKEVGQAIRWPLARGNCCFLLGVWFGVVRSSSLLMAPWLPSTQACQEEHGRNAEQCSQQREAVEKLGEPPTVEAGDGEAVESGDGETVESSSGGGGAVAAGVVVTVLLLLLLAAAAIFYKKKHATTAPHGKQMKLFNNPAYVAAHA